MLELVSIYKTFSNYSMHYLSYYFHSISTTALYFYVYYTEQYSCLQVPTEIRNSYYKFQVMLLQLENTLSRRKTNGVNAKVVQNFQSFSVQKLKVLEMSKQFQENPQNLLPLFKLILHPKSFGPEMVRLLKKVNIPDL